MTTFEGARLEQLRRRGRQPLDVIIASLEEMETMLDQWAQPERYASEGPPGEGPRGDSA